MKPPRHPDVTRIPPAMAVALEVYAEHFAPKKRTSRRRKKKVTA